MLNKYRRSDAVLRRFTFEFLNSIGVFWIIDKIEYLDIKEPWKTLYKRTKKCTKRKTR
jgi:hypothetical protein